MTLTPRRSYLAVTSLDQTADMGVNVAVAWTATRTASSPTGVAVVLAATVLPQTILALLGGAVSDRIGGRRIARLTLVVRSIVVLALAAVLALDLRDAVVYVILLAAAGLYSALDGFHFPALGAMIRNLAKVERDSITARAMVLGRVARLVGAPLAGLLIAVWSTTAALLVLGTIGFAAAWAMRFVPQILAHPDSPSSLRTDIRAYAAGAWADPRIRTGLLVIAAVNGFATGPVITGAPLISAENGWSAGALGVLEGGAALGAITGGLVVNWSLDNDRRTRLRWLAALRAAVVRALPVPRDPHRRLAVSILLASASAPATFLFVALSDSLPLMILAAAANGITGGASFPMTTTALRLFTPEEQYGRLQSWIQLSIFGLIPVSHLAFAGLWTFTTPIIAAATMTAPLLVTTLACYRAVRRTRVMTDA